MGNWNLTRGRVLNIFGIEHREHGNLIPKWKEGTIIVIDQFSVGVLDFVDVVEKFLTREDLVCSVSNNS